MDDGSRYVASQGPPVYRCSYRLLRRACERWCCRYYYGGLTTARYYTPSGVSIQAKGIAPDIEVALARIEKLNQGPIREEDLRGALDGSEEETDGNASDDGEQAEAPVDPSEIDFQLARALDLLRGLTIFKDLNLNN